MSSRTQAPFQVVRGFCMGAADVVPGVSGGTIALVFGIYTDLLQQVRQGARALGQLVRGRPRGFVEQLRLVDWWFLLPLLVGAALAVLTLARVITHFLDEEPVRTAAVFFGLVVGSILTTVQLVKRWHAEHVLTLVGVAVVAFVVLGLRSGPVEHPALPFVLVGGMIAICAFILPGVSGSFLLLMLGLYDAVLESIELRELDVIAVFGVGAVIGLAGFSSLLTWAIEKYDQLMLAGLIGLMVGSLRVLWPWPEGTEGTSLAMPADDVAAPVLLALGGAVLIVVIARIAGVQEHDTTPVGV